MKFGVKLHGEEVLLRRPNQDMVVGGFFCWKCVEAPDETTAITLAVEKARNDPGYKETVLNPGDREPKITAEKIVELDASTDVYAKSTACAFYFADDSEIVEAGAAGLPGPRRPTVNVAIILLVVAAVLLGWWLFR